MASVTLSTIIQRLSEAIGDWLSEDTTTNISTDNYVISTNFAEWDYARDDWFNNYWLFITEGNNSDVNRRIKDYLSSATYRLELYGAALAAESSAVTVEIHHLNRENKVRAINDAIRELFPKLYLPVEDRTLSTGNILPDCSFEDWTSATALRFYSTSNANLAQTTTAGAIRGPRGTTSAKVTASAANGYMYIDSDDYPRLLDLMGRDIDFKCWASASTADDVWIQIVTTKADGTTQSLPSGQTQSIPARSASNYKWTLLELEDQSINDDIVKIEFRFRVDTNGEDAYFDSARVNGKTLYEYLLPDGFKVGDLWFVEVQSSGYSDDPCDDILPHEWVRDYGYRTYHDGTYKYLRFSQKYEDCRQIRLIGAKPFTALTSGSDTIEIDAEKVNLLVAYSAYKLFDIEAAGASSEDKARYEYEASKWYGKYLSLQHLSQTKPTQTIKLRTY